jgi:hypothetical protein
MRVFIEIRRVTFAPQRLPRVLELRGALRERSPHLRQADLVRLSDDVWLDMRTLWADAPVAEPAELQLLVGEPLLIERGERVHTTGTAWAAGR